MPDQLGSLAVHFGLAFEIFGEAAAAGQDEGFLGLVAVPLGDGFEGGVPAAAVVRGQAVGPSSEVSPAGSGTSKAFRVIEISV